jgi:hypothetical protein
LDAVDCVLQWEPAKAKLLLEEFGLMRENSSELAMAEVERLLRCLVTI